MEETIYFDAEAYVDDLLENPGDIGSKVRLLDVGCGDGWYHEDVRC